MKLLFCFRRCIWLSVGFLTTVYANFVTAAAIENYQAALHAYMSTLDGGWLPITPPNGEQPGDIYLNATRGFEARKDLCFENDSPTRNSSILPGVVSTNRLSISGELGANIFKVVDASVDAGYQSSNEVQIRFGGAYILSFDENTMRTALRRTSAECAELFAQIRSRGSVYSNQERIPWILSQVLYASIEARIAYTDKYDAAAAAKLEETIKKVISGPTVSVTGERDSTGVIVLNTQRIPFPVAYTPAFISTNDVARLKELDNSNSGLIAELKKWFASIRFGTDNRFSEVQEILSKYPNVEIAPPEQLYDQMQSGERSAYESRNPEHIEYLQNKNMILTISLELNPPR